MLDQNEQNNKAEFICFMSESRPAGVSNSTKKLPIKHKKRKKLADGLAALA